MIHRLPEEIASRIAAGEVVERPVSVVKELLENALDAGSTRVTVAVRQGGRGSIVVEDNGGGIPFEELPLSLERYATSKLQGIDDLEHIGTLGYRGEALSSIAAVGRVELRSRRSDADEGGMIRAEAGEPGEPRRISCTPGTRVQVEDLFFNLPARRKFLKSAAAEYRRIVEVVQRYALAYPQVAFQLYKDGRRTFAAPGDGELPSLLEQLWGPEPPARHASVEGERSALTAWWQPAPGGSRMNVVSFVNGRFFQDGVVRAALHEVRGSTEGEWLLFVRVPPEDVDVNIHPAKREVRFKRSREIFDIIRRAGTELLGAPLEVGLDRPVPERPPQKERERHGPPLSGNRVHAPSGRAAFQGVVGPEKQAPDREAWPFDTRNEASRGPQPRTEAPGEGPPMPGVGSTDPAPDRGRREQERPVRYLGQLDTGYLLFDDGGDLLLMDPHAAHERVRYEEILDIGTRGIRSQGMAEGIVLPPTLAAQAEEYREGLAELGFSLTAGAETVRLDAVPSLGAVGEAAEPVALLRAAVAAVEENRDEPVREIWARWAMRACRGAVKLGERLAPREAERLLQRLQNSERPDSCPHGRPTVRRIAAAQLARYFGRE